MLSILAFIPIAAAFQQAKVSRSFTALRVSIDDIKASSGVSAPTGYFDPAGLMENDAQLKAFAYYKEAEIKHGRVAMLAAAGYLVAEKFHPLFGGNIDTPSLIAFQQTPLQTFWPLVVLSIAYVEFTTSVPTFKDPEIALWEIKDDHAPGDFGFDPLGIKPKSEAGFKAMATREINNGRLAMIAIAGMVGQELATGGKL